MQGMILQTPTESKDIKLSSKKSLDTQSKESGEIFEDLIEKLILKEGKSDNADFLLGKLLNLKEDFSKKGKTISEFSKGDLLSMEEEGTMISLEELFKVALSIKNGETFSTSSQPLKIALDDKNVISQFKEATNIKELLNIADKNGIKVKNFEFFLSEKALDPKDKKMVQKITSEEIFKMIEPKSTSKEKINTENFLSKIITKDVQQKTDSQSEKTTTLTSLLSKEHTKKGEVKAETAQLQAAQKTDKKQTKIETKSSKLSDIVHKVEESSEKEITKPLTITENINPKEIQKKPTHTLTSLLQTNKTQKEFKPTTQTPKEDISIKDETISKEVSTEKTTHTTNDIKSDLIHKTKEPHDVKKTFNTFAAEFKEKVEAYKPPLMKIKMQLSPQSLGDVDVTLVSRGNNLQVNINSNNNTLALFVQNQAEFKNSLVNMGFSDLQMNFGDKRGEERNNQQQKGKEQEGDYHDSLENEEVNGIEMILPNYV